MSGNQNESSALARAEDVAGVHHELAAVNEHLKLASANMNLIAPATRVGSLPPGCGVSLNVLRIDPTVDDWGSGPDCYKVDGGKLAPSKHVIDRIGAALGISWDPKQSGRTDDRRQPYYWSYRAVGTYRQYDGSVSIIQNEYEWDVRDESARVEEMWEKPKKQNYKTRQLETNEEWQARIGKAIRQMRKFGLQRAVSGARLRAMSDIGFKRSYTREELQKPFVIARLHFSGHTDDPEERRMFGALTANAMLGGVGALFPNPAAPAAAPALPPPADEEYVDGEPIHEGGEADCSAPEPEPKREPVMLPTGTAVHESDNVDLEYWGKRSDDEKVRDACAGELKARAEGAPTPGEKY